MSNSIRKVNIEHTTSNRSSLNDTTGAQASINSTDIGKPSTSEPSQGTESSSPNKSALSPSAHQRLVFTDPVAFRYLEEDPSTVVLDRRRRLEGYEIYVVEQWACSRVHPTFVICTYTGDPSHSVLVGVLGVPTNERTWSPRLKVYFKAISQYHARRKETPIGTLMVTNLSGFPSALTVVAIPDGDVKQHREDFIVNENLKRMGCAGRAGLNIQYPTPATEAKFYQLYKTSDRIPLYGSVIELLKLCQTALTIFAKLAPEYADGLLCDVTERAINDWWSDIGTDFYNVEPRDGILGPTTVSALLGLVMGARNRLHAYGAPVGKDVFDLDSFKRGIAYFQKSQKLERSRRLDRQTFERLHRVTAKAASSEGWTVPKAVKSTVAELSGKGGEMVMGMVGAREKAGIAEVETLDIDRFVELIHGERSKWLWYGKPRKSGSGDIITEDGLIFSKDDQGNYSWSSKKRDSTVEEPSIARREPAQLHHRQTSSLNVDRDHADEEAQLRKGKFRAVTGRVGDARSGLSRFKDAVGIPGLRGHHNRHSKDLSVDDNAMAFASQTSLDDESFVTLQNPEPEDPAPKSAAAHPPKEIPDVGEITPREVSDAEQDGAEILEPTHPAARGRQALPSQPREEEPRRNAPYQQDLDELDSVLRPFPTNDTTLLRVRTDESPGPYLQHSRSFDELTGTRLGTHDRRWWPRHLSYTTVEDAVSSWDILSLRKEASVSIISDPNEAMLRERLKAEETRQLRKSLAEVETSVKSWVTSQVDEVEDLDRLAGRHIEELALLYHQRLEAFRMLQSGSADFMASERTGLTDALRDVEGLGAKLEYEVNALQSKVGDVEDGLSEFERQIEDIEGRIEDLMVDEGKISWPRWFLNALTGFRSGGGS